MDKNFWKSLIPAALALVMGILFCCDQAMGTNTLSVILGVVMLVMAVFLILLAIVDQKAILTGKGVSGAILLALGLYFVVDKPLSSILAILPYFLTVIGAAILVDAFLAYFLKKTASLVSMICSAVVGAAGLVLGLCLLLIDSFWSYVSIVVGIILIVAAIVMALRVITAKNPGKNEERKD